MCGKTRRRAKDYAESFFDPRSKPYGRLRGKVKKKRVSLNRHEGPAVKCLRSLFLHTCFDSFSCIAMLVFSFSRHCRQTAGRMTK